MKKLLLAGLVTAFWMEAGAVVAFPLSSEGSHKARAAAVAQINTTHPGLIPYWVDGTLGAGAIADPDLVGWITSGAPEAEAIKKAAPVLWQKVVLGGANLESLNWGLLDMPEDDRPHSMELTVVLALAHLRPAGH